MDPRRSERATGRRGRSLPGRGAAIIAGLALLVAGAILVGGSSPPSSQVLGVRATPVPGASDEASLVVAANDLPHEVPEPTTDRTPLADPPTTDLERRVDGPRATSVGEGRPSALGLAPDPDTLTGYAWPIRNARLTLPYGPSGWGSRIVDGERFHDGIDLATFCGDRITAAHAGIVLAAGRRYDEFIGWIGDLAPYNDRLEAEHLRRTLPIVVVTDDGNGVRSLYAHFRKVVVKAGDPVEAGDLLGYEGATGRASGCHLHFGLFSPEEVATIGMEPDAAARMLLPLELVARIDPLVVLPPLEEAGIR